MEAAASPEALIGSEVRVMLWLSDSVVRCDVSAQTDTGLERSM